jgi:uncharacterized protein YcnI
MNKIKQILSIILLGIFSFSFTPNSFAKVDITPEQVAPSATQVFTLGVTAVKESSIVKVKLIIPEGVESITPNVNLGWNIEVKKDGDKSIEILWAGGILPTDRREDFVFAAKTSPKEDTLKWKVYETYQDGTEVSWDQEQKNATSETEKNKDQTPYLTTSVTKNFKNQIIKEVNSIPSNLVILLAVAALFVSLFSLKKAVSKNNE